MITKAIIPVAGWGTRRLPVTKAIEKCMLPLGNRPVVDYIVQDCVRAGIRDIYFVVSGDALFKGSIGRTDLHTGNLEQLIESIQTQLFTLPDHYEVFPGHGEPTTIAWEKQTNPFFNR